MKRVFAIAVGISVTIVTWFCLNYSIRNIEFQNKYTITHQQLENLQERVNANEKQIRDIQNNISAYSVNNGLFNNILISIVVAVLASSIFSMLVYRINRQKTATENSYRRRLEFYPEAFEIIDKLDRLVLSDSELSSSDLLNIRDSLSNWYYNKSRFILSKKSAKTLYKLLESLHLQPGEKLIREEKKIKYIGGLYRVFRKALRRDLNLIYSEEMKPRK